jgi:hypothetical protein
MEDKVLRQRLYHLVPYNLSEIQKGIQAYHAGIEYALKYGGTDEFKQWANKDKTIIILNGGTSNRAGHSEYDYSSLTAYGTMEKHEKELFQNEIDCATFFEPDLNSMTSAIAFLADERVWDKETYPDPIDHSQNLPFLEFDFSKELEKLYGKEIAFLRIFLKQFKLA